MQNRARRWWFLVCLLAIVITGCSKDSGQSDSIETIPYVTNQTPVNIETQKSEVVAESMLETDWKETEDMEQYDEQIPDYVSDIKGIKKFLEPVDYSDIDNWLSIPEDPQNPEKQVDVIFLYPTVYGTAIEVEDDLSDIDDMAMRIGAAFASATQASVFEESCNIFVPVYRQLTVPSLLGLIEDRPEAMQYIVSQDLYRMLDHYFTVCNNGRPFFLAGHSQGSVWLTMILEDYMKQHPEYLQKMVAAYAIGYSITEEYLVANPHLKFAERADDTGVIISYNTEGPGNKDSYNCVVRDGAVAINPINWRRDDSYAAAEENLGSLALDGEIVYQYADARLDLERGVVVCETTGMDQQMQEALLPYFGPESYHLSDYSYYYMNLRQNVAERIDAFLKETK